jgi:hypothetical protein
MSGDFNKFVDSLLAPVYFSIEFAVSDPLFKKVRNHSLKFDYSLYYNLGKNLL